MKRLYSKHLALLLTLVIGLFSIAISEKWNPNLGNNKYKNPIIHADYSDPDVVKVGDDFYMTASSFNCMPALPILHSKDLVNWELINHAIKKFPDDHFNTPQHGNGVWAPSFRYHDGEFYIYYGDPDLGIYMVKTDDPYGEWEPPVLVKDAHGNIDPCPLWDDDGKVYMVHAFAHSRAGVNSLLQVVQLNDEGTKRVDKGRIVFDGHEKFPTIEGPKFYKRNGYYYIFAPAGGVSHGWQTVLRSKNIYGPYESKNVLHQGNTDINGPHQGAYVELDNGQGWFIHFQEKLPYGRIVHLQPVEWENGWPVMGKDKNNDGIGEPVLTHAMPDVGQDYPETIPQTTDEFSKEELGLQWQWHANYYDAWYSLKEREGHLRLYSQTLPSYNVNLWKAPNLLLQKFPAPEFEAITKMNFNGEADGEQAGLMIMGRDYSYLALEKQGDELLLKQAVCEDAEYGTKESVVGKAPLKDGSLLLKVKVNNKGECIFSYSPDGKDYKTIGEKFEAREGKWIGAKVGLFTTRPAGSNGGGYTEFDYFRIK